MLTNCKGWKYAWYSNNRNLHYTQVQYIMILHTVTANQLQNTACWISNKNLNIIRKQLAKYSSLYTWELCMYHSVHVSNTEIFYMECNQKHRNSLLNIYVINMQVIKEALLLSVKFLILSSYRIHFTTVKYVMCYSNV